MSTPTTCSARFDAWVHERYLAVRVWWINRFLRDGCHPGHLIVVGARPLMVTTFILVALLVFFADVRYGDRHMSEWCIVGSVAGSGGGILGCCTAIFGQVCDGTRYRVPVSRHGLGSFSPKCCRECSRDAALASMALTLSLLAAAALGSGLVGLLGLLLSMLHHFEVNHGWETLANATEHEFSLILSAASLLVAIYAAVRHHYKSRVGWWMQGEHLFDGDPQTDLHALL